MNLVAASLNWLLTQFAVETPFLLLSGLLTVCLLRRVRGGLGHQFLWVAGLYLVLVVLATALVPPAFYSHHHGTMVAAIGVGCIATMGYVTKWQNPPQK